MSSRYKVTIPTASTSPPSITFSASCHRPCRPRSIPRGNLATHPLICAFNSELFHKSRLHPRAGLENQTIRSKGSLNGAGLRYLSVEHQGNQSSSREETDRIRDLVAEILASGTIWVDREGVEAPVGLEEILIIALYNAEVFELQERIPGAGVGTVDKFQEQEAPIVIQ